MQSSLARNLPTVNSTQTLADVVPLTGQIVLACMRAVRDWRGSSAAKAVLNALLLRMNDKGAAWPSVATIGHDTGLSPSTVQRALRAIERDETCPVVLERHFVVGCSTTYRLAARTEGSPVSTPVKVKSTPVTVTEDPSQGDTLSPQDLPSEAKTRARAQDRPRDTRAQTLSTSPTSSTSSPTSSKETVNADLYAAVGRPVLVPGNPLASVGIEGIAELLATVRASLAESDTSKRARSNPVSL